MRINHKLLSYILSGLIICFGKVLCSTYNLSDLKLLYEKKDYQELLDHVFDIPPHKRSEEWEKILHDSAVGLLKEINLQIKFNEVAYQKLLTISQRPYLKSNQIFFDHMLKASLRYSINCMKFFDRSNSDEFNEINEIKQNNQNKKVTCLNTVFQLSLNYFDEFHFDYFYKLFIKYVNDEDLIYKSTFQSFIIAHAYNISLTDKNFCHKRISEISPWLIEYIKSTSTPKISRNCFAELKNVFFNHSYSLQLNDKIRFIQKLISLNDQFQKTKREENHYNDLFTFYTSVSSNDFKSIYILLSKMAKNPQRRELFLNELKKDKIIHPAIIKSDKTKLLLRQLNLNIPELLSWYYSNCKKKDRTELSLLFCSDFISLNNQEKFIGF